MTPRDIVWIVTVLVAALVGAIIGTVATRRTIRPVAEPEAPPREATPASVPPHPTPPDREFRRAKDAAEAANAAKTRYMVAVSHEIRSPLNAIYGYAQLLERDGAISCAEAGSVIRRSAEHLTNLVEGMLEISQIEGGVLKLSADIVQFPALLDQVFEMFRMQASAKGLELRHEATERLPRFVRTDERRLRQILINLLSNAIKYTSQGSVTLSVRYRSQVAEIDVADTGIGIAPEDLHRIFEPFERGSSPDAMLQPGIGLGLAITRMLARIMGGEIAATSTPGAGSQFRLRVFLPEPQSMPSETEYSRIVGYRGPRRTVLVIDDHQAQTVVLDSLLRPLGFTVYTASSGREGLALAERCRADLVLLDIQMSGIDGWEVAARLRATHGDAVRIVMVSANTQEQHGRGAGVAHHNAFVPKPVDLDALLAVIGRELALAWDVTGERPPAVPFVAPPPPLPHAAGDRIEQLRRLAKVGHIRGVEAALADLEASVPESAPAVAAMRDHVRNFDLRSLMKMLDGQPHER